MSAQRSRSDWIALQQVLQDASATTDAKPIYRDIRNFLAGRVVGATRDEALLDEVVKCLLCKTFLVNGHPMRSGHEADAYRRAFAELRTTLHGFDPGEAIRLDDEAISFIDLKLSSLDLHAPTRDPLGDLYETFMGSTIRGQEGQFFTPQNAVELLVSLVDPQPGETILDPASGAGGFLSAAARHLVRLGAERLAIADSLYGVEKDDYLASLAQRHVVVAAAAPAHIVCGDSLAWIGPDGKPLRLPESGYDVILTNPPFGARIVAASEAVRERFELARKWSADGDQFTKTAALQPNVPPQVLFLERCLQLVRPGGRIGMVVPESMLSGGGYGYVRQFLLGRARVDAVVGMPESLFKTSGKGGTHTKTALLVLTSGEHEERRVFMAEAKWCGHDSRGNPIPHDDLPEIAERYRRIRTGKKQRQDWLGFHAKALRNGVLAPRYYDPEIDRELRSLKRTHHLVVLGDLVASGRLHLRTGDEVGKLGYGAEGGIPFVRTSDISTWEIKVDPKHRVERAVFEKLRRKQDVRENDLLMVKDGTYLIGTCALVTKHDTEIVYQSHLYKMRVAEEDDLLNPWLLLAVLTSAPVRRQIRAKSFTQDIIDSLGRRVHELVLPVPRVPAERERITGIVKHVIDNRVEARELARQAAVEVAPLPGEIGLLT